MGNMNMRYCTLVLVATAARMELNAKGVILVSTQSNAHVMTMSSLEIFAPTYTS